MSSDSMFSSAPRTSRPPPRTTMRTTSPPPLPSERHRLPHKVKKEKGTGGSSSSGGEKAVPLSVQGQVLQVLAMALVAWLVATGGFKLVEWIQLQLRPFCDSFGATEPGISDNCNPCPENGSCRDGVLECFVGFKRVGRSCVKDKEIDQSAEKLVGYLKNHVCGLAARAVCEGASGALRLTADEAQEYLKEQGMQKQLGVDDKSWQLVWEKMARIAEDSIAQPSDLDGTRQFSCPADLVQAYKPVRCRVREWLWANFFILLIAFPVVVLGSSSIMKCVSRRKIKSRAEEVYLQICEALEERALESRDAGDGEPWVVVSHLRDHVLLPRERRRIALWKQIEGLVKEDSRIDRYQKKVKGEMKIVWEWQVEGALRTPNARKKVSQKTQSPTGAAAPQQ